MDARRIIWPVILGGLLIFALSISFSGCTQTPDKVSLVDVQAEIHTAVAATVDDLVPATQPAADTGAKTNKLSAAPAAAAPTDTLAPTPTDTLPPPTATSTPVQSVNTPTPTPTSALVRVATLEIVAEQNTNCRLGPSTRYSVDGYLMVGMSSEVHGRTTDRSWWYIKNPTKVEKYCWVWSGSTVVKGDTSGLAVVAAPDLPKKSSSCWCGTYVYGKQLLNCKYGKTCKPPKWSCCEPTVVCQCQIVTPPNLCKMPKWYKKACYGKYWTSSCNYLNWCGW